MEWNACGEGRVALSAGGFHVSSGTPHQQRVVILGRLSARTSDRPGIFRIYAQAESESG